MDKPWYKSLTIIGLLILTITIILDYLLGNFAPEEISKSVAPLIAIVKPSSLFVAGCGIRRVLGIKDEGLKPPPVGGTQ